MQIMELFAEVNVNDRLVSKLFDLDSEKMLDQKISVLTQLENGVPPKDIPKYHAILELYSAENVLWD